MLGCVVFGPVVSIIEFTGFPIYGIVLGIVDPVANGMKRMSIALVRFGWILLLTTPSAHALSVCIGVGGCV